MTAQLLPPFHPLPFISQFDSLSYARGYARSLRSPPLNMSSTSLSTALIQRSRQASPASLYSTASAPVQANKENAAPARLEAFLNQSTFRSASPPHSLQNTTPAVNVGSLNSPETSLSPPSVSTNVPKGKHLQGQEQRSQYEYREHDHVFRTPLAELGEYKGKEPVAIPDPLPSTPAAVEPSRLRWPARTRTRLQETSQVLSQTQTQTQTHPQGLSVVTPSRTTVGGSISSDMTPLSSDSYDTDRKRHSGNSSGFVHTIKTASLSGGSFSIIPRSLGLSPSADTRGLLGSHSRFSADSDRPLTASSVDEGAVRRGLRRRQILEEITNTEESYVADLKALVYLMSTLLASATSMSNRVRNAVLRNVLDLLHLHEAILDNLHRAAFKAAARKWADTRCPHPLGSPRHMRWKSLEQHPAGRKNRRHRRARSSMDSTEMARARARLVAAEPADVTEVVAIFTSSMNSFFLYEEYCANHEVTAHDLQRHLPVLWSTYGAGIESLGRMLVSLEQRNDNNRKGMTVGDLLVKPIQRVCRYPLLFDELLRQTPVADCPSTRAELEYIQQCFRGIVESVNTATSSPDARLHIQRRWILQSRLSFDQIEFPAENFRLLGDAVLCGVLHIVYQTSVKVDGHYALCLLYEQELLIALPTNGGAKFDVIAVLRLPDIKVESACDGKGLQCPSALHTWKLCFAVNGDLHEFVLSACTGIEETQWKSGLRGELLGSPTPASRLPYSKSSIALDLRSVGVVYGHHGTLARRLSIQRAATVGNRASVCRVIVKNTHSPEELHEFRRISTSMINRSQSHVTTNRITVLAPKRAERARLESILGDVWTKDKLPHPGMIASRGGQILRASAGSLVRKLSLASIHGPFSRRSASLTVSSKKSSETITESERSRERIPTFQIRRDSFSDKVYPKPKRKGSHDVPELDTMDSVVNRMIGDALHYSQSTTSGIGDDAKGKGTLKKKQVQIALSPVGPSDLAQAFYATGEEKPEQDVKVEDELTGKKKRWSSPMGILRGRAAEGLRHMLYSSK